MNAGDMLLIDIVPDSGSGFLTDGGTHLLIPFSGIRCLLRNPFRLFFQNFSKGLGNLTDISLRLLQLMGVQIDIFHRNRSRQNIHIPVEDISPVGCDGCCAGLIAQGKIRIVIIIPNHQSVQPQRNRDECKHSQQQRHQHHPGMLPGIQTQAIILLLHSLPPPM